MAKYDLNDLVRRVQQRPDQKAQIKLRTLLKYFGYSRRSPEGVASIHEQLAKHGIAVELSVTFPETLDGRVTLALTSAASVRVEADSGQTRHVTKGASEPTPATPRPVASQPIPPAAPVAGGSSAAVEMTATPEPPRSLTARLLRAAQNFFKKDAPAGLRIDTPVPSAAGIASPQRAHSATGAAAPGPSAAAMDAPRLPVPGASILPPGPSDNLELSEVAESTIRATVFVEAEDGFGSGFIVHPEGLVVTACHVLDGWAGIASKAKIRLHDGRESTASLVRAHRSLDFAMLWIDLPGKYPTLNIGHPEELRYAETVLAVGHPGIGASDGKVRALTNTVSTGVVANPACAQRGVEWIQMTTDIDPGNSGGPLVNRRGEAIGINCWKYSDVAAAKMALPLDYLEDDVTAVTSLGRAACTSARVCSICGSPSVDSKAWFCPTCGAAYQVDSESASQEQ